MSPAARRTVIAVVVLVALLVAADRIALVVAEGVAADTIKTSQHLDTAPSVSARGFPFLTQLVSGHYDEVDVVARGLDVGPSDRPLRIDRVSVQLRGVHISNGFDVVQSDTATATAQITYADLSARLGTPVRFAGDGRVRASASATVAGVPLNGTVTVRPVLASSNQLAFTDTQVSALGVQLPASLTQALNGIFDTAISLQSLPFGLRFTSIAATASGVQVSLAGSNLVYDSRTGQTR